MESFLHQSFTRKLTAKPCGHALHGFVYELCGFEKGSLSFYGARILHVGRSPVLLDGSVL